MEIYIVGGDRDFLETLAESLRGVERVLYICVIDKNGTRRPEHREMVTVPVAIQTLARDCIFHDERILHELMNEKPRLQKSQIHMANRIFGRTRRVHTPRGKWQHFDAIANTKNFLTMTKYIW